MKIRSSTQLGKKFSWESKPDTFDESIAVDGGKIKSRDFEVLKEE